MSISFSLKKWSKKELSPKPFWSAAKQQQGAKMSGQKQTLKYHISPKKWCPILKTEIHIQLEIKDVLT